MLRFFERIPAHRTPSQLRDQFKRVIGSQEKIPPGEKARIARQSEILVFGAQRIKLVELLQSRQFTRGLEVVDDRERD